MFPLLQKDGLRVPYFIVLATFSVAISGYILLLFPDISILIPRTDMQYLKVGFVCFSYVGMLVLHLLEAYVQPPARYPDLYPALIALYSLGNLLILYGMGIYYLYAIKDINKEAVKKPVVKLRVPSLAINNASGSKAEAKDHDDSKSSSSHDKVSKSETIKEVSDEVDKTIDDKFDSHGREKFKTE